MARHGLNTANNMYGTLIMNHTLKVEKASEAISKVDTST